MPRLKQPGASVIRLANFPEGVDYNHEYPPFLNLFLYASPMYQMLN